jgi:DNA repair protein RecO (recombination protein O)
MNQINTKALVLRRVNYNEADRIMTLITEKKGRVSVIAKGVRKQKSKLAGGIELLSISEVGYIVGKSNLYTLTSTRLIKHFSNIIKDIDKTMLAYRLLELVYKITEDSTGSEFFELLSTTLESLDTDYDIGLLEIWFNLRILQITGHSPNLNTDVDGNKLMEGKKYVFDIESMCFGESKFDNFSDKDIKLLRILIRSIKPEVIKRIESIDKIIIDRDLILTNNLCRYYLNI